MHKETNDKAYNYSYLSYQPSRFLFDSQAKILPSHQKIAKSIFFVLTCDALCPYILNAQTALIFKQKYSKSSKFDTFLKQKFICRLVGMLKITSH